MCKRSKVGRNPASSCPEPHVHRQGKSGATREGLGTAFPERTSPGSSRCLCGAAFDRRVTGDKSTLPHLPAVGLHKF